MATLRTAKRNDLEEGEFAYPEKRKLPINDASHVRNALARFNQTDFADDGAKRRARSRILRAAKKFGVDVDEEALKMSEPFLVAGAPEPFNMAEGREMVVARVGEWDFGDQSYGEWRITMDDAQRIVENFQNQVRRQDLPIVNEEHIPAEYGPDGDPLMGPGAVGWLKELRLDGDKVVAVPDWNAAGERIAEEDRYRAVSPEIIKNWTDPETGESHGMTLVGLALSNFPKMKGLAGQRLAASEDRPARARVLAFSEEPQRNEDGKGDVPYAWPDEKRGPLNSRAGVKGAVARFASVGKEKDEGERTAAWKRIKTAAKEFGVHVPSEWKQVTASEATRYMMADMDPDNDGDVDFCDELTRDEILKALSNGTSWTTCPHCTGLMPARRASDGMPYYYSEEDHRMDPKNKTEDKKVEEGKEAPAPPAATKPAPTLTKKFSEMSDEELATLTANMGENANIMKALMSEVRDTRAANVALQQRVDNNERITRLADINDRLAKMRDTGRITPAEFEKFSESDQVAKFSENDFALSILESRPEHSAVPFNEKGKAGGVTATGPDSSAIIDAKAKEFIKAAGDRGEKMSYRQAALLASAELSNLGYQG